MALQSACLSRGRDSFALKFCPAPNPASVSAEPVRAVAQHSTIIRMFAERCVSPFSKLTANYARNEDVRHAFALFACANFVEPVCVCELCTHPAEAAATYTCPLSGHGERENNARTQNGVVERLCFAQEDVTAAAVPVLLSRPAIAPIH